MLNSFNNGCSLSQVRTTHLVPVMHPTIPASLSGTWALYLWKIIPMLTTPMCTVLGL